MANSWEGYKRHIGHNLTLKVDINNLNTIKLICLDCSQYIETFIRCEYDEVTIDPGLDNKW